MKLQLPLVLAVLAGGILGSIAILRINPPAVLVDDHGHAHEAGEVHAHDDGGKVTPEEGPRGGKLLHGPGFDVEVTIFEDEVPPEFRIYGYRDGQPMGPAEVQVAIELRRLGGRVDAFAFQPQGEFLRGAGVVREPHSFDVVVRATYQGQTSEWIYESYEGRATILPGFARSAGIVVAQAGPATIQDTVVLQGEVRLDADRMSRVGARFPGLVKEVRRQIGEAVAVGDVLAVIESNESLQSYEVKAPQSGIVLERLTNPGAVAGQDPLFVLADPASVWIELNVFPGDATRISPGLPVVIQTADGLPGVEVVLPALQPMAAKGSQTRILRIRLDNADGRWAPGLRVTGTVQLPPHEAPLAVRTAGLQSFRDFTVVFAQVENTYEVRMLELGRADGNHVEVLGGLEPGERYVVANSFLVKADAMKSGASHDH